MSLVFAVALILVIGGVVMVFSGRWSGMTEPARDRRPQDTGTGRFDVALRGYRMDEVDARIEELERENAELRAGSPPSARP